MASMKTKKIKPAELRLRPRGAPMPAPKTILTKRDKSNTRRALKLRLFKEGF